MIMSPVVTSYPLRQHSLSHNSNYSLFAVFLFAWVGIGVIALPLEFKFLGKKFIQPKNSFTFIAAILLAMRIGALL
jgi:hypothetical protein